MERPLTPKSLSRSAGTVNGLEGKVQRIEQLDPVLKSWLDRVLLPLMVRDFVDETTQENRIASRIVHGIDSHLASDRGPLDGS